MMNQTDIIILSGITVIALITASILIAFGIVTASGSWIIFVVAYIMILIITILSYRKHPNNNKNRRHKASRKK